jgi:hypothetical protein
LPVITDPPHARPPVCKNTQDCNYVRVIVVMRPLLSRGGQMVNESDDTGLDRDANRRLAGA